METNFTFKTAALMTLLSAPFIVSGCGGGGGGSSGTGTMSLAVTDAPVDGATEVVVEFTGVEVKSTSGGRLNFDFAPRRIDLLALNGGGSEILLDQVTLPAGNYNFLRLKVNAQEDGVYDSFIKLDDGAIHELTIPTAATVGLKIGNHFTIAAGGASNFTIDFDLRKSVHKPEDGSGDYKLRPTLRLVDNLQVGSIAGTVAPALINEASCVTPNNASDDAVYVYAGAGIIPDDVDGIALEPITSAMVTLAGTGTYSYKAAFLVAGEYTVAFTCQAVNDDPEIDDTIAFVGAANVTVTANTETAHNF